MVFCHDLHVRVCMLGSIEPLGPIHPIGPNWIAKSQSVVMLRCDHVQHGAYYTLQGYEKQSVFGILAKCSMHHAGHNCSVTDGCAMAEVASQMCRSSRMMLVSMAGGDLVCGCCRFGSW